MNVYTFNNYYNNLNDRQRSQTLQPDRDFMLRKYFHSQWCPYTDEKAKYANVAEPMMAPPSMQSQHNCHQPNNYYNMSGSYNVPPASHVAHEGINTLRLFEVLNELYPIDAAPPMPSRRNYVIRGSIETGLFKIPRMSTRPPC